MANSMQGSNMVSVNGNTVYVPAGANVQVRGNDIYVDGKKVDAVDTIPDREITVIVQGDTKNIETNHGDITVEGSARDVTSTNGNIVVEDSARNVKSTNGHVQIGKDVYKNVRTMSGNVRVAGGIHGGA